MVNYLYKILGLNKQSSLAQYLVKGSSAGFIILVYHVGLTFLNSIIVANLAGDTIYGRYTYINAWLNIFCVLSLFGFHTLAVREIPKLKAAKNLEGAKHYWQHTFWWVLLNALLVAILGWTVLSYAGKIGEHNQFAFKLAMVALPFWTLSLLLSGFLRGSKHIVDSQLPLKILLPTFYIVAIGFFAAFFGYLTVNMIIGALLIALVLVFISSWFLLKKDEPWIIKKPKQIKYANAWTKVAFLFFFQGIIASLNSRFDILVLENYCSEAELAYYDIAIKISSLMGIVLLTVNLVIAPEISKLYANKQLKKLEMLVQRSIKIAFLATIPITFFLIIFGPMVLKLFGKSFEAGYPILIIFTVVQIVNVGAGSVGNILNMTGHEKEVIVGILISLAFNVGLNLFLVPRFGMMGAALATGFSIVIWNIILWMAVKQKIGINASIFNFNSVR